MRRQEQAVVAGAVPAGFLITDLCLFRQVLPNNYKSINAEEFYNPFYAL